MHYQTLVSLSEAQLAHFFFESKRSPEATGRWRTWPQKHFASNESRDYTASRDDIFRIHDARYNRERERALLSFLMPVWRCCTHDEERERYYTGLLSFELHRVCYTRRLELCAPIALFHFPLSPTTSGDSIRAYETNPYRSRSAERERAREKKGTGTR